MINSILDIKKSKDNAKKEKIAGRIREIEAQEQEQQRLSAEEEERRLRDEAEGVDPN